MKEIDKIRKIAENSPFIVKKTKPRLILAFGFFLLLVGVAVCLFEANNGSNSTWLPVILLALGEIALYIAFVFYKRSFFIALGFMFILNGILFSVISTQIFPLGVKQLWPIIVINAGLCLIPADLFMYKRFRTVFLFPAILLIIFGLFLFLFSLKIIPFSFSTIMGYCFPLLCFFCGLFLIVIFIFQQKNSKQFPYMQDDSTSESINEENVFDGE